MFAAESLYRPHARQLRKPTRSAILSADAKPYPGYGVLALASMTANSVRLLQSERIAIQYVRTAPNATGRSKAINGKERISAIVATDNPNVFYKVQSTSPHHLAIATVTAIVVKG